MSQLRDLAPALSTCSPAHRRALLAIFREDPSLIGGFLQRFGLKREGRIMEVIAMEQTEVATFLRRLDRDAMGKDMQYTV